MLNWINFFILIFWFSFFGFLLNPSSFLNLLVYSEVSWLILYSLSVILGAMVDDITSVSITFFILGFAGLEFSFAFLLLILFRVNRENYNIIDNSYYKSNINSNFKKNSIFLDSFFWIK